MKKERNAPTRSLDLPPEGFARPDQVAYAFGVSIATIYNYVKAGKLPKPEKDGARITRWPVSVIRECLAKQGGSICQPQAHQDNQPIPAS